VFGTVGGTYAANFLLAIIVTATLISGGAFGQSAITSEVAPSGKLRVTMNASTAVLLKRTPEGKITGGVGFEVGKFIAERLGVPFEILPYPDSNTY
jgi:hypothetical protein